jgi:hypothetical protein
MHVRRDSNICGSRLDLTALGEDGDKLVFAGDMIPNEEKPPTPQIFTKNGHAAHVCALVVKAAEAHPIGRGELQGQGISDWARAAPHAPTMAIADCRLKSPWIARSSGTSIAPLRMQFTSSPECRLASSGIDLQLHRNTHTGEYA